MFNRTPDRINVGAIELSLLNALIEHLIKRFELIPDNSSSESLQLKSKFTVFENVHYIIHIDLRKKPYEFVIHYHNFITISLKFHLRAKRLASKIEKNVFAFLERETTYINEENRVNKLNDNTCPACGYIGIEKALECPDCGLNLSA